MLFNLNKIFLNQQKPSRNRLASRNKGSALTFTTLEDRNLLASIVFDAGTSELTIFGSSGNDSAFVNNESGGRISVSVTGAETQQFDIASVNRVTFFAGDGDDLFENNTAINSFFGAQGGNDTFRGGSGDDIAFGGSGVDDLRGNGGADLLQGGADNDIVRGGAGDDKLHGNDGDDLIFGDTGNDTLYGERDNDEIHGGDGNDTVSAFSGDDVIFGDAGNDLVFGQHGDDTIYGGAGDDRLRGNPGHDIIRGESGNDFLLGDQGDDHLIGGNGSDTLLAYTGNDTLEGNAGNDFLFAGDGSDNVDGGTGNDVIGGGAGDDVLRGGDGNDTVRGEAGNDLVYGGEGVDLLVGNDGNDSLFGGGFSSSDQLIGNAGQDRFLIQANNDATFTDRDSIVDAAGEDAVLRFINFDSNWTDTEIEIIDGGLQQLFDATDSNRLLKDSLPSGDLRFLKYTVSSLNGFGGLNVLQTTTRTSTRNGVVSQTFTYDREIRIADWDETSEFFNNQFRSIAIHEVAHNWDSEAELTIGAGLSGVWGQWLGLSGWTQNSSGDWSRTAPDEAFVEEHSLTNPFEDFATAVEVYFSDDADQVTNNTLQSKLDLIDTLFAAI